MPPGGKVRQPHHANNQLIGTNNKHIIVVERISCCVFIWKWIKNWIETHMVLILSHRSCTCLQGVVYSSILPSDFDEYELPWGCVNKHSHTWGEITDQQNDTCHSGVLHSYSIHRMQLCFVCILVGCWPQPLFLQPRRCEITSIITITSQLM